MAISNATTIIVLFALLFVASAQESGPTVPVPPPTAPVGSPAPGPSGRDATPVASSSSVAVNVPGLEHLRTDFTNEIRKEADVIRQQMEALRALEKNRADLADYSGAARAKAATDALLVQYGWLTNASTKPAYILDAANGVVAGGAASRNKDSVELIFSKEGGAVKWELPTKPGSYEVKIRYKAPSGYESRWGGKLEFREDSGLAASAPLEAKIAPAEEYNETVTPTQTKNMGSITLSGSRATLVLRSTQMDGNSIGVARVLGLDLAPISADQAAGPGSEGAELLDLRQKHLKIQREKLMPTHQAWLTMLKEMGAAAGENCDREIIAETNRIQKLTGAAADPATPSILSTSGKRRSIKLNPLDSLTVTSAGSLRTANTGTHLESIMTGARISFRITPEKVPPGSYQVVVSTKMGPGMGGTYHLKVNDKTVSGEMSHEQYGSSARRWDANGKLTFPTAPCYLEFYVDSTSREKGSLCDLYGVELIPVDLK